MSWKSTIRDEIRALKPIAPRMTGRVRLDCNESPVGLDSKVMEDLGRFLASAELHRYPDHYGTVLRKRIAGMLDIDSQNILLGNGVNELTRLLCSTFSKPRSRETRARVAFPSPGPSMFRLAALSQGTLPLE